jgi:hypothetical protein
VTKNPTQVWLSHQIAEAFPWDTAPRYLLRNRDASYGPVLRSRVKGMGVEEVVIAPRSPWQNPFVEHVVGSIRRECLDHVIVFNERHLRHVLSSYFQYYHEARTHLSLNKDCPQSRPVQPPSAGKVVAFTKSAGCTTATNVRPLDRLARQAPVFGVPDRSVFPTVVPIIFKIPTHSDRHYRSRRKTHADIDHHLRAR